MTVKQLIEKLSKAPENATVVLEIAIEDSTLNAPCNSVHVYEYSKDKGKWVEEVILSDFIEEDS